MEQWAYELAAIPAEARAAVDSYAGSPDGDVPLKRLLDILLRVPEAAKRLAAHGIEEAIIRDTLADIGLWCCVHRQKTGHFGLNETMLEWLTRHVECRIFRVGRLQCRPYHLSAAWNLRLYRNRHTGHVLAVTAGDAEYREDGQVSGTNGIYGGEGGFRGYFRHFEQGGEPYAEGIVLSPYGRAENKPVRLNLRLWDEILCEGMPSLELHVPADGPFDPDSCRRSLVSMAEFTAKHEAALASLTGVCGPYAAFTLGSWLIDAQLDGILPPTSNIVRNLREFYLIPALASEVATLERVFGVSSLDIDNLKPEQTETRLQRAIVTFMRNGGRPRYNYGIILLRDVEGYGAEQYRRNFDRLKAGGYMESDPA